jgi:RNA polymerase sigma factor (sigma-70 family)
MRNNEMNLEKSESMNESEINQYFKEFLLALDRKVQKISGFRLAEADDFKQYCACWLLERPALMSKYKPHVLASVVASQRSVDFIRQMSRQVPQGRYVKDVDARDRKAIQYLDNVLQGEEGKARHEQFLASKEDIESDVVNNLVLGSLLKAMTPRQQQVYLLVEVEGHKVVEAADELGLKREMAQRELGKARKVVAELREEFGN